MFHWCPCEGLFGSSVEFTSFHSLFTLVFIFLTFVNFTEEGIFVDPLREQRRLVFFYGMGRIMSRHLEELAIPRISELGGVGWGGLFC